MSLLIRRIIKVIRFIVFLIKIDGLCFKKRAGIRLNLFGAIWYHNEAEKPGDPLGKEFYSVPIFIKLHHEPLRVAIHEVRHRVQWNHPEMPLLTEADLPISMRSNIRYDIAKKLTPRELDAQTFDEISLSLFQSKQISAFLKLMFGKDKPRKEG